MGLGSVMFRPQLLALPLLVLSTLACTGGDGTSSSSYQDHELAPPPGASLTVAARTVPNRSGDLRADLTNRVVPSSSSSYREARPEELQSFEAAFGRLLALGATPEVQSEFAALQYAVSLYRDAAGVEYLVLEDSDSGRSGGTFVVNLMPARELIVEAPHSDSDEGTAGQSTAMFFQLGARALLLNGTHRCASSTASACSPENSYCGNGARVSDAAQHPHSFFTAAHRALRAAHPQAIAASIHGMETDNGEAAVIGDGTEVRRPGSIATRLRDATNARLPANSRAFSCNDAADDGKFRRLCGTTNAQAKFDNASPDACIERATQASDRFVHVEQSSELRHQHAASPEPDAMTQAFSQIVPCSLGDQGLGCSL